MKIVKGDTVCHWQNRKPLTVDRIVQKSGTTYLVLTNGQRVPRSMVEHYPQVGDRVVIAAAPYEQWYRAQIKNFLYTTNKWGKQYHKEDKEWMSRYSPIDFPWDVVFEFKNLSDGLCTIYASGYRYQLPIDCLRVIEKVRKNGRSTQVA